MHTMLGNDGCAYSINIAMYRKFACIDMQMLQYGDIALKKLKSTGKVILSFKLLYSTFFKISMGTTCSKYFFKLCV